MVENLYLCHKIGYYMEEMHLNMTTRDEVLKRYKLSRQKKQQRLRELEEGLRADFKKATGLEANSFVVWWLSLFNTFVDEEGIENTATLIIRNDNPDMNKLIAEFTQTVTYLSQKPSNGHVDSGV